jgi:hypothetical protein
MAHRSIAKVLSKNDTGETGAHQAGILVPKESGILSFFPKLDAAQHNPRCHLTFLDSSGTFWEFAFIYYNGKFFEGTRNEFRLTRMTTYIRQARLVAGDEIILSHDGYRFMISNKRRSQQGVNSAGVLKLGTGWRVVSI